MQKPSLIYQYLAAIVIGLFKLSDGMLIGWVSPNMILLKSNDTPLTSGELTDEEASWIPTLMPFGALVGILVYGFVSKLYGRKIPHLILTIPKISGWLLLCFADNVYYLCVGRLLLGFAIGGCYVVAPLYLVEIANDRIRGILGASVMVNENTGVLLGYAIGGFCPYRALPAVAIVLNLLFIGSFVWFPETPAFLVSQNKMLAAEKSIRFYQNLRVDDKETVEEIMYDLKKAIESTDVKTSRLRMSDITTRPGSKAMLIAIVLSLMNQGSGVFTLMNYSAEIFQKSGSFASENLSSVIVQAIQAIGTCFVAVLIERAGRRFLFIVSTVGCALGYLVLGTYLKLLSDGTDVQSFNWVPLASFAFILFISSWAVSSITFTVIAELLPQKLREIGLTVSTIILSVSSFCILKVYPTITSSSIGVHGCMYIFSSICIMGAAFVFFMLPEIKGKSYEEIMKKLGETKQRNQTVE